jgi:hypothetical protein
VNKYSNGLSLELRDGNVVAVISPEQRRELAILKHPTWFYVIEAPGLAIQQHAKKQAIRYLFNVLVAKLAKGPAISYLVATSKGSPAYSPQRVKAVRDLGA